MSAALNQFVVQDIPATPTTLPKAPRGARFLAFILDSIFSSILNAVGLTLITKGLKVEAEGIKALWSLTFFAVYWVMPIYSTGQTLGKRLTKIQVVPVNGGELSFRTALLREFPCKILSGLVFCLGYVRILTHADGRAWHDSLAKTRVVSLVEE